MDIFLRGSSCLRGESKPVLARVNPSTPRGVTPDRCVSNLIDYFVPSVPLAAKNHEISEICGKFLKFHLTNNGKYRKIYN